MHEPDDSVQVTSDDPVFEALTMPVAPISSAEITTVNEGVVSLVMSSVPETPVSLAASRFGAPIAIATVSITIALAPATLLSPNGTVLDVMALPAVSATVPTVKPETFKSGELWPAETV